MHTMESSSATYGEETLRIEPYGIEHIGEAERHGRPWSQGTLWLGSNLTIADFALGFSVIGLGLPWFYGIVAILIGNVLGAALLGGCAAMGPSYGQPQLMIGRYVFGRWGSLVPTVLNVVSTIGWFTVNNILGAFGLQVLWPHLPFWLCAVLLVVIQGLVAVFGHNFIHVYERIMAVVLGVLFLIVTVLTLHHGTVLASYHPIIHDGWATCVLMIAFAFSYVGSWGTYASDYSRYLPEDTSRWGIFWATFAGAFIASVWLELVGAGVAILDHSQSSNPIAALHQVMGPFGDLAVIAVILGGTAADALNLYSNALSAAATGIRLPRWLLVTLAAALGLVLSLLGSGAFQTRYDDFLLFIGYWITPWLGVLFANFYVRKRRSEHQRSFSVKAMVSFLIGILASIPFMNSTFHFEGIVAERLGGADLAFYVGFFVAMAVYLLLTPKSAQSAARS